MCNRIKGRTCWYSSPRTSRKDNINASKPDAVSPVPLPLLVGLWGDLLAAEVCAPSGSRACRPSSIALYLYACVCVCVCVCVLMCVYL